MLYTADFQLLTANYFKYFLAFNAQNKYIYIVKLFTKPLLIMSNVEIFQTAEFNLSDGKALAKSLQKLKDAKRKPIGAMPVYWSPEAEGEVKRVVFLRVVEGYNIPDYNDQEQTIQKNTAFFIEVEDETARILTCAATRLVSYFEEHGLPGGAYDLVYLGKIKNKTNNNLSSHFEIFPVEM